MQNYKTYIDESGNTGDNLTDKNQKYFVLAGVSIPISMEETLKNTIRDLFMSVKEKEETEIKATKWVKTAKKNTVLKKILQEMVAVGCDIQIKCDSYAQRQWEDMFEKYFGDDKEACINIICKLVQFYPKEIRWNNSFHTALLGAYQLPDDNMLSRLSEKHTDLKDVLDDIIFLHNYNTQILSENNALVKMAKERQKK